MTRHLLLFTSTSPSHVISNQIGPSLVNNFYSGLKLLDLFLFSDLVCPNISWHRSLFVWELAGMCWTNRSGWSRHNKVGGPAISRIVNKSCHHISEVIYTQHWNKICTSSTSDFLPEEGETATSREYVFQSTRFLLRISPSLRYPNFQIAYQSWTALSF